MTSKSFGMHHKVCNVLMHKPPPLLVIHEACADTYATTWYTNHNTTSILKLVGSYVPLQRVGIVTLA